MPHTGDLIYRIDDHDLIVYVNAAWDVFARANHGQQILGADVLRRSLWDFIADQTTRKLYGDVLKRIRDGRSVRFSFRCDSPDCRRFMDMQVETRAGGLIESRECGCSNNRNCP